MTTTDRRDYGVYTDISDESYVAETTNIGRTVFMAGCCPKGRHNRVLEYTSQAAFHNECGKPNFNLTTQSHYNFSAAMALTNRGYYIRVMPLDSKVANVLIEQKETSTELTGDFIFTEAPTTKISKPYPDNYSGGVLDADYITDLALYKTYLTSLKASKTVTISNSTDYAKLTIGDWIYAGAQSDPALDADTSLSSRQIIAMVWDEDNTIGTITLNDAYVGETDGWTQKTTNVFKYVKYISSNSSTLFPQDVTEDNLDLSATNAVFAFYANGAGSYYNNLFIKGVRDTSLEKMYTDDNGNVLYKYMFMNISIYEKKDDGTTKRVEGPWRVSLANRTSGDVQIRSNVDNSVLYITEVINTNSKLITCVEGPKVTELVKPNGTIDESVAEDNRLRVMLLLASSTPVGTDYVPDPNYQLQFDYGDNGHSDYVENGDAPIIKLYENNMLQIEPALEGLLKQAYEGTLESVDGSIVKLREHILPWYLIDYIVTGGFSPSVQEGGRALAESREDCIHLGDSGYRQNVESELAARATIVPYNNWTSALYTQYRKIKDPFTGQWLNINPCYHAIQRHLICDDKYFIAEPVANIEKGAISEEIKLAYSPDRTGRGDLIDSELNYTINEPDGKYINCQLTTWKRSSILKRLHAAKFVAFCKQQIPKLLKDIVQRKGTPYWIGQINTRVSTFLNKYTNSSLENYKVLSSYGVNSYFDAVYSEANVIITLTPIRAIERINVSIIVE